MHFQAQDIEKAHQIICIYVLKLWEKIV